MKTILTALLLFLGSVSFGQSKKDSMILADNLANIKIMCIDGSITPVQGAILVDMQKNALKTVLLSEQSDSLRRIFQDSIFEAGTRIETLEMVKLKDSGIAQSRSFIYPFFHQFVTKPIIEKQDVIIYSLQFVAGLADGMNQALVYHHALAGYSFWDYATSWLRKYKNYPTDQRAAFPGAKTWSVMFTDGNHFTRGVNRGASVVSVAIAMHEHDKWYEIVKEAIIASLINRLGFTLVYDHLLK